MKLILLIFILSTTISAYKNQYGGKKNYKWKRKYKSTSKSTDCNSHSYSYYKKNKTNKYYKKRYSSNSNSNYKNPYNQNNKNQNYFQNTKNNYKKNYNQNYSSSSSKKDTSSTSRRYKYSNSKKKRCRSDSDSLFVNNVSPVRGRVRNALVAGAVVLGGAAVVRKLVGTQRGVVGHHGHGKRFGVLGQSPFDRNVNRNFYLGERFGNRNRNMY